ncbi:MAG TPA: F0F1 ATP synthase subunit A [Vulgatibacter sp.]|nr:F0F1 ATP synthase subunit A [Vulgatibacter sp.]
MAAAILGSALTYGRVAAAAEGASVPEVIFDHVSDGRDISFENPITGATVTFDLPEWKVSLGSTVVDLSLTRHTVFLWLAMAVVIVGVSLVARKRSLVPRGFYSVVEVFVKFVREELAEKNIGKGTGDRYVPFLASLFFIILTANLIGLIPFAATATANINVTVGLSILTFVVTLMAGMRGQGVVGFWAHIVPNGVPIWLYPIMLPVEILSMLTKPFALTIRLFANMVAGHIVLFFLLGLIFLLQGVGPYIAPVSVAFATAVYFLELFVALLQAYIFVMLSALFIGMASHPH